MDNTERLLRAKYCPETLQVNVEKSTREYIISCVMSSNDYPDALISKACSDFNLANPDKMSNSYQLLAPMDEIPVGSWIFISYTDNKE